ncbi:MAG: FxsA family protein [Rhodobacteraceae bacterium]|nr:FxsA family protein [Paracoccaceae bacterium]
MRIVLALIALPLIEIALFVQTGRWLGLWPVLGLVIASGLAGVMVLARGRVSSLRDIQHALEQERDPAGPLAHAALRMLGGVLLVMPGFFTDTLGLLLMVPGLRGLLLRRMGARMHVVRPGGPQRARADVIDGDYEVHEPRPDTPWSALETDRPQDTAPRAGRENRH